MSSNKTSRAQKFKTYCVKDHVGEHPGAIESTRSLIVSMSTVPSLWKTSPPGSCALSDSVVIGSLLDHRLN